MTVITLTTQVNTRLLQHLKQGFKRSNKTKDKNSENVPYLEIT